MKYLTISLSILCLTAAFSARGDDLPKRPDANRYAAMLEHSPFVVATAPVQAPTTPNWSKDLYIANAAHTDEADYVTIVSGSDKNLHESLSTAGLPNEHGYAIANIQWSDNRGETKVTISKDGQYATLGFNESLLSTASAGVPGPPQPNVNNPPNQPYVPKPIPTPVNAPTPHTRGVIERNPRIPQGTTAQPYAPPSR